MQKLKIRKVEATSFEIFQKIDEILLIDESLNKPYLGTSMKSLCKFMGINEIEFWGFRLHNNLVFDKKYYIYHINGKHVEKFILPMSFAKKLSNPPTRVL